MYYLDNVYIYILFSKTYKNAVILSVAVVFSNRAYKRTVY